MFLWHQVTQHFGVPALVVAAVLVVMGAASLVVFFERLLTLRRARTATLRFLAASPEVVAGETLDRIHDAARANHAGDLPQLVASGIGAYVEARRSTLSTLPPAETARRHLEREVERLVAELRRGLPVLATVGSTAPFVGLLGTVFGIITAFQAIAATGSGGLSSVSAGIAEALIETALGLAVAIPAVLMFNVLSSLIVDRELRLRHAAGELADALEGLVDPAGAEIERRA